MLIMFLTCDNGLISAIFLRNLCVQKTKPVRSLRNLCVTIDQCGDLFILHKNVKPSHFHDVIIEKEVLIHTQKKSFRGLEKNVEAFDHCPFYLKNENFSFVLFHLKDKYSLLYKTHPYTERTN